MDKKSKMKNRIFAGFLALTLMGCKPVLVKGEELVQEEIQTDITLTEIVNDEDICLDEDYLNYLKETENKNIKRLSQIDKFNKRFNK